jgi:hypothetical protein
VAARVAQPPHRHLAGDGHEVLAIVVSNARMGAYTGYLSRGHATGE